MASIGPALPPDFIPECHSSGSGTSTDSESDSDTSNHESDSGNDSRIAANVIGPALPPSLTHSSRKRKYPVADCFLDTDSKSETGNHGNQTSIGPVLPSGFVIDPRDSDEEDPSCHGSEDSVIGPLPYTGADDIKKHSTVYVLEERSRKMKHKLIHGDDSSSAVAGRETWMTVLPSIGHAGRTMGLTARKLTTGRDISEDDRKGWTETPSEREQRLTEEMTTGKKKSEKSAPVISERDKFIADQVEEYNKKKRSESLLALHTKKLKKKNKKKEKKEKKEKKKKKKKDKEKDKDKKSKDKQKTLPERRPFDRDIDLQVNRFDAAQRKSLIKRSQVLNSRFGHGGNQFL